MAYTYQVFYYCCDLPVLEDLVNLSIESDKEKGWEVMPSLLDKSPNLQTLVVKVLSSFQENTHKFCSFLSLYMSNGGVVSGSCAQSYILLWRRVRLHPYEGQGDSILFVEVSSEGA